MRAPGRHRADPAVEPAPGSGGVLRAVSFWCAVLCLPAIALVVFFAVRPNAAVGETSGATARSNGLSAQEAAALAAGKRAVQDVLAYDYRSINADIAKATADTTGTFRQQYTQTADTLRQQAGAVKAIVQATVGTAGVVDAQPGRVILLLFVDQASVKQLANSKSPTTRIDQDRVRMTMSLVHGKWLVSALEAL